MNLNKIFTSVIISTLLTTSLPSLTYAKVTVPTNANDAVSKSTANLQLSIEEAPFSIPCNSYLLMDIDTGRIIYGKNVDKKIFPASTTKLMTAIVGLESNSLDTEMTASYTAVSAIGQGGMHIGISDGEIMKLKDLTTAMLLNSANETCNIVAENTAGSIENFVKLMNKKAKLIGASHTHFVNTHGIHNNNHYSTARDLATIARYAYTLSPASATFQEICQKESYTLDPTNKHKDWYGLHTTNKLHSFDSKYWNKVLGLKTGYVDESGHNFIGLVENAEGTRLLSVITGVTTFNSWNSVFYYTNKLLNVGYQKNKVVKLQNSGEIIKEISIKNSIGGQKKVNLLTSSEVSSFLPNKIKKSAITSTVSLNENSQNLEAPIKKGVVLGKIDYYMDNVLIGNSELIVESDVNVSYSFIKTILVLTYCLFIGLFISFALYVNSLAKINRKKRRI